MTEDEIEAVCRVLYGDDWNGPKAPGPQVKDAMRGDAQKIIEAIDEVRSRDDAWRPHHLVKETRLERKIASSRAALEQIAADPNGSGADHAKKAKAALDV
jgi:hypothetical protein